MNFNLLINLNAYCRVKPTDLGWEILERKVPRYKSHMGFKNDGYYSSELWDIMYIFGEDMVLGRPNAIDTVVMFDAGSSEVTIKDELDDK